MGASDHGIQATGEAIDGRFKGRIIFIRKDYAEGSIYLGACQWMELSRDEREGDEVAAGTLSCRE